MSRLHKHPRSANADYRCVPLDAAAEVTADLQERINRTLAYIERVKPHMPELTTRSALDAVVAVLTTNEHSKSDTPDAAR
jgi:nitroimidazol reductase NimA-like FMN-containing flavoprotein (pyridoxamine 5'-phosphate oxidase superfamily)